MSEQSKKRKTTAKNYELEHSTEEWKQKQMTEKQVCGQCKQEKILHEFTYQRSTRRGRTNICKRCAVAASTRVLNLRKCLMQIYLMTQKCAHCSCDDWRLLENDHIDSSSKAKFASGKSIRTITKSPTLDKMVVELLKCQTLCITCHRIKTDASHKRAKPLGKNSIRLILHKQVQQIKLKTGECQDCKRPVTLETTFLFDYDHVDPSTKIDSISNMIANRRPLDEVQQEINKCRLICCACHRLKTRIVNKWVDLEKANLYPEELSKIHAALIPLRDRMTKSQVKKQIVNNLLKDEELLV